MKRYRFYQMLPEYVKMLTFCCYQKPCDNSFPLFQISRTLHNCFVIDKKHNNQEGFCKNSGNKEPNSCSRVGQALSECKKNIS